MKRVPIIRSGAVGDLILTLPVLSALKKRCEGLSIDMMGDLQRLSLLKQCGYVDDVLSIDSRDFIPLFGSHASPADGPALRNLQSYDAIISYLPDSDGVFTENLRRIAVGSVLSGRAHPVRISANRVGTAPSAHRTHMTHVLMKALGPLGMETVAKAPMFTVPASAGSEGELPSDPGRPLIAVHPGSGGPEKCWPADCYVALIEALVDRDYEPVITFGHADDAVRSKIVPRIRDTGVRITDDLSLVDLGALISRCKVMVGNDSGITHLAAALGVTVIALFGPTDPAVWGPRGEQVGILWGDEAIEGDVGTTAWTDAFRARRLTDITLESVLNELVDVRTPA